MLVLGGALALLLTEPIVVERFVAIDGEDNSLAMQELDIQQQVARSVRLAAAVDLLQLAAGAVTVGLLYVTFRAAAASAKAALTASETGVKLVTNDQLVNRAYLFAIIEEGHIAVRNYGGSVAIEPDFHVWKTRGEADSRIGGDGIPDFFNPEITANFSNLYGPPLAPRDRRTIVKWDELRLEVGPGDVTQQQIVWIRAKYVDVFGCRHWKTFECSINVSHDYINGVVHLRASSDFSDSRPSFSKTNLDTTMSVLDIALQRMRDPNT